MKWKHATVSEASAVTNCEPVVAESLHRGGKLIRMSKLSCHLLFSPPRRATLHSLANETAAMLVYRLSLRVYRMSQQYTMCSKNCHVLSGLADLNHANY